MACGVLRYVVKCLGCDMNTGYIPGYTEDIVHYRSFIPREAESHVLILMEITEAQSTQESRDLLAMELFLIKCMSEMN